MKLKGFLKLLGILYNGVWVGLGLLVDVLKNLGTIKVCWKIIDCILILFFLVFCVIINHMFRVN